MEIKGYKVFNPDWTCRDFQYSCPGTFEDDNPPVLCEHGFHFCERAVDCFRYYVFDPTNKVAEVVAFGKIKKDEHKCVTDKIKIIREISWEEVLRLVNCGSGNIGLGNTGNNNSGDCNTGYCNSGNHNSGGYNSGNYNCGGFNIGDGNSGSRNYGSDNTGDFNIGDGNTGFFNFGDYNSGDFNYGSRSNGCFNTTDTKIYMFNKLSDWTLKDWRTSKAYRLMCKIFYPSQIRWKRLIDVAEDENIDLLSIKATGGVLREGEGLESVAKQWDKLSPKDKKEILSLPNFDPVIFKQITGIDINIKEGDILK